MGALSYADDITLICPSLRGMNCMLNICSVFADNYDITFNSKKTLCIKFGEKVNDFEKVIIKGSVISWD